jgi:hypothetical protein
MIGKKIRERLDCKALLAGVPQFDRHGPRLGRQQTSKIHDHFAIPPPILSDHGPILASTRPQRQLQDRDRTAASGFAGCATIR